MIEMTDWEMTSTTIHCDDVKEDVTLLVANDMSVRCTGQEQHQKNKKCRAEVLLRSESRKLGKWKCKGVNCPRLGAYKDKILSEETNRKAKIQMSDLKKRN